MLLPCKLAHIWPKAACSLNRVPTANDGLHVGMAGLVHNVPPPALDLLAPQRDLQTLGPVEGHSGGHEGACGLDGTAHSQ